MHVCHQLLLHMSSAQKLSTLSLHAGGSVSGEAAEKSSTPPLATILESTLEAPAADAGTASTPAATSASTPAAAPTTFSAAAAVSEAVALFGASAAP